MRAPSGTCLAERVFIKKDLYIINICSASLLTAPPKATNGMTYTITAPQHLNASIDLPASKSISNRALVIYALSGGEILPEHLSNCDDTEVIVNALWNMPDTIDIKAAGTAMRFMTAYLAVTPGTRLITGTERMKHRPISILVDALRRLGAEIEYAGEAGFPPLRITGKRLEGGFLEVQGDMSSQFISALLMIGPALRNGLTLKMRGDIISRPYIDLTLCTMRDFGAEADWTGTDTIEVKNKPYRPAKYFIESDWSAASYWYEIAALCREDNPQVELKGLMDGSLQGDSVAKYLFSMLGIRTVFGNRNRNEQTSVALKHTHMHSARLDYNFINQPDLAQTFVVTCAAMGIPFHFTGLATLRIKETDRIEALKREMRKLGFVIGEGDGTELIWNGERCVPDADPSIDTYEDHRMAMAFAPLAMTRGSIRINNPGVVTKSYPSFWDDLRAAGFGITEE